ncbi:glycosyl transferase [Clostridium sp. KNHs205]|jgi:hypothetical protein|uniref:glycosyl transferase n=1 Tax=Clostridium sp. KNHs205 TaxID=1449050 RepID=UPI00051C16B7|nr:glycosyl transferase [Clostridium sp. KNHs205]
MNVAILTMFSSLPTTYSLVNVVAEQLYMLLRSGMGVKVIVNGNFDDSEKFGIFLDERIEWVKIPNEINGCPIRLFDYKTIDEKLHDSFYEEAEFSAVAFEKALSGVDVCILHDILYTGWNYVYNIALRIAQKNLSEVRFLAFSHSFPVYRPLNIPEGMSGRFSPMPNTLFVYPTASGIPALARQYDVPEGQCRVVYNSIPLTGSLCREVQELHSRTDLISPDVLMVYPGRLTLAKKFDKVAAFAGCMHKLTERTVKVVLCDFPSADIEPEVYKAAVRAIGKQCGLSGDNMIFTSDYGYPQGFPRQGVLDLFTLSNLFVCPSLSETFALTAIEAASRGNFIVLNQAVPALNEIGTSINAYFMKWDAVNFGYQTSETYVPSEKAYYEKHAAEIYKLMREDRSLFAKTMTRARYSSEWIWKNQLEPLITG